MNLFEHLEERALQFPDRLAFQFEGQKLSYQDLVLSATQLAKGLRARGIQKGDVVALMLPNRLEFIQSYFAIQRLGAVALPINLLLSPPEIEYILKDSQAKALVFAKPFFEKMENYQKAEGDFKKIILTDQPAPEGTINFFTLFTASQELPPLEVGSKEQAALLYTSGTTGSPKGVMLSHKNLLHMGRMLSDFFGFCEGAKSLLVLPLFHIFGLSAMQAQIHVATSMVLMQQFDPLKVLQTFEQESVNIFYGVPAIYGALLNAMKVKKIKRPATLTHSFSGGAPLPLEMAEQFERLFGFKIAEGYGLTEAAGAVSFNPSHCVMKNGTIGLAVPGNDVRVVDEKGMPLPPHQVGEIVIKGDNVMMGYLNQPEASREVLKDGWLHTGDLAYQDEEGYLTIVDRKKDMIIVGGENVYPKEVEEALYQYPGVLEAVVIGVPHERMGQVPKAFLVVSNGQQEETEEIRQFLEKRLAKFKIPRLLEFRKALPKSAMGKILKRELQ